MASIEQLSNRVLCYCVVLLCCVIVLCYCVVLLCCVIVLCYRVVLSCCVVQQNSNNKYALFFNKAIMYVKLLFN